MFRTDKFSAFDPDRMKWSRYVDQLKLFLSANEVADRVLLPTVLTLIGDFTYNLLCDLIAPAVPTDKNVDEIFSILSKHFSPKPIARSERYKFRCRVREPEESVQQFVAALRKMSLECCFEGNLDKHLGDQFIFGLRNPNIQRRLLAENDDTSFEDLVQIAVVAEMTAKDSSILCAQQKPISNEVFKFVKQRSNFQKASDFPEAKPCNRCGKNNHLAANCRFLNATCNCCNKKGHLSTVCRLKNSKNMAVSKSRRVKLAEREQEVDGEISSLNLSHLFVNNVNASVDPVMIKVKINNVQCTLEMDTGAAITLMPVKTFRISFPWLKILNTDVTLRTFKEKIVPVGKVVVNVKYNDKYVNNLDLFIIKEGNISLIGRTWLKALNLLPEFDASSILSINPIIPAINLNSILDKYKPLFESAFEPIKNIKAHIYIEKDAHPKFCKARQVPYAMLDLVEAELIKLQGQNIIAPIQFSEWASPVVPIMKKHNEVRLCGDYKVGLNPVMLIDKYPLPKIEDILAKLSGGIVFSKLDMLQAYQQVEMDEESTRYLTINTHKGLFKVNRLPFGIASAPSIFQRIMDQILSDLPGVICYLDDILVMGKDLNSHLDNLDKVLHRLQDAGIHLNRNKCEFLKEKVEYLGHIIEASGIHTSGKSVQSILNAPAPENQDQLRSFLGLTSYYRKFLPNLSTMVSPLNNLLQKNVKWCWDKHSSEAFEQAKKAIASPEILVHFDTKLPITLACDASPYGLGAVISHSFPDGSERPIAFASRSLTRAEKNYSQIDKEALGIMFGVKKFHQFLFGRKFTLFTDHKPLTRIFASDAQVPVLAAARLQRWALMLSAYAYEIKFRKSSDNANADALSRLPMASQDRSQAEITDDYDVFIIEDVESFPITYKEIAEETGSDPILSQVLHFSRSGWPKKSMLKELNPFFHKAEELSILRGCIMWGIRVIIPKKLQPVILSNLHSSHVGITKMKMMARSLFWWPNLDQDIIDLAHTCETCCTQSNSPPIAPVHHWSRPSEPWQRIHVDFAGPFLGYNFLVIVDAFSKWPEVTTLKHTTTSETIKVLETLFNRYGYPFHIVSDNGTQFISSEFQTFCAKRGIKHTRSAPYHPATNGQAERFVQILKKFLKKCHDKSNLSKKNLELLFSYRSTPHCTTKKTPAELFLGRQLRTKLHLIKPPPAEQQLSPEVGKKKLRTFVVGQNVLSKSFKKDTVIKWIPGEVIKVLSPVSYLIKFQDGNQGKRHVDQLRPSFLKVEEGGSQDDPTDLFLDFPNTPIEPIIPDLFMDFPNTPPIEPVIPIQEPVEDGIPESRERRNPPRIRNIPARFKNS